MRDRSGGNVISESVISNRLNQPIGSVIRHDLQTVAEGGSAVLLASVFGNGLNYFFGIYIARALGPADFGLYILGLTFFNALALLAPLGLDTAIVKFISHQRGEGRETQASSTLLQVIAITAVSGLVFGLGLAIVAPYLSSSIYRNAYLTPVLFFFAAAVPLSCVGTVLLRGLQAFHIVGHTVVIKYLWEPIGKCLLSALALLIGFGLYGVLAVTLFTLGVSVVVAYRSIRRRAGIHLGRMHSWNGGELASLFGFSLPLIICSIFSVVAPRTDLMMLGYSATPAEVGIYNAAFQTAAILSLILGALDASFAPMIGKVLAMKEWDAVKELYQAACRWTLILAAPLFILIALFGKEILGVFGTEFSKESACLVILAVGQLINAATGMANTVLLMSGHSRKVMWNTVVFGLLLVITNGMLIPHFGMLGAAMAASINLAMTNIIRTIEVWSLLRVQPCTRALVKPLLAGLLVSLIGWIAKGAIAPAYHLLIALLLPALYGCFLYLFEMDRSDRAVLGIMIRRAKRALSFS